MDRRIQSLAIIATVLVLDRITKLYIQANFDSFDSVTVIPGVFNIIHSENPGAAFGMLANAPEQWRTLALVGISGVIMAAVAWVLFRPRSGRAPSEWDGHATRTGLALVLGGALGNLWDRAVIGTVTDFLQVFIGSYEWPAFNIADSAICIGAGLMLLEMWKNPRTAEEHSSPPIAAK